MTLTITTLDRTDRDTWDRAVARAPGATLFHQFDALDVVADHSEATPHLLVGMNGAEIVGLLPVFEDQRGGNQNVLSPPWLLESTPLGPAMVGLEKMSRRKQEQYTEEFVAGATDWIARELTPDFIRIRADGRFGDVRPFLWHGFDAAPYYTYVVDLAAGSEAVLANFSKDARKNVTSADPDRFEITERGVEGIEFIIEQLDARYAEQDKEYRVSPQFVADLYERLPDGQVRPYVCAVDGEDVSGMVVLEYGDRVYRWEGGARHGSDLPVTDLLDWHVMQEAMDRGVTGYDLVGANNPRLCKYKAKFGPDLEVYYNLSRRDGTTALRHELATAATHLPWLVDRVPGLGRVVK